MNGGPTPLLDFFKRGEVARDVRMLAAQGALAPRAHEQLAILVHLVDDPDPEVRRIAESTLQQIPVEAIANFLAREDVPTGLIEFFADRGVFPSDTPLADSDEPFVDTTPDFEEDEDERRETILQRITEMGFSERLKAAMKGSREMRAILIRDTNKMIAAAVLSSPKLTVQEVEGFARMANVSDDVLRVIGSTRAWTKSYAVIVGLSRNPKTPVAIGLSLVSRLQNRDLLTLTVDRNIPDPVRRAARQRVTSGSRG